VISLECDNAVLTGDVDVVTLDSDFIVDVSAVTSPVVPDIVVRSDKCTILIALLTLDALAILVQLLADRVRSSFVIFDIQAL